MKNNTTFAVGVTYKYGFDKDCKVIKRTKCMIRVETSDGQTVSRRLSQDKNSNERIYLDKGGYVTEGLITSKFPKN